MCSLQSATASQASMASACVHHKVATKAMPMATPEQLAVLAASVVSACDGPHEDIVHCKSPHLGSDTEDESCSEALHERRRRRRRTRSRKRRRKHLVAKSRCPKKQGRRVSGERNSSGSGMGITDTGHSDKSKADTKLLLSLFFSLLFALYPLPFSDNWLPSLKCPHAHLHV